MNTPVPSTVQLPSFLAPNKVNNPFALDPNFQYWLHNYGWWHHMISKEGTNFDIKLARIAYSLGSLLVKDRLSKEDPKNVTILEDLKIKVFDFGLDADMSTILEKLCGKVQVVRPSEVPNHLFQQKLQPTEDIVFLTGISHPQPPETFQAFFNYVHYGGRFIMYNCGMYICGAIFPGRLGPAPPSTVVKSKMKILNDRELFTSHKSGVEIQLETVRYPISILDKTGVSVIALAKGQRQEPLLVKFSQGAGTVHVFTSKMFGALTLLDPKKKPVPFKDAEDYLRAQGASQATIAAWICALKVGYVSAVNLAGKISCIKITRKVNAWASIEVIARILIRESAAQAEYAANLPPVMESEEKPNIEDLNRDLNMNDIPQEQEPQQRDHEMIEQNVAHPPQNTENPPDLL